MAKNTITTVMLCLDSQTYIDMARNACRNLNLEAYESNDSSFRSSIPAAWIIRAFPSPVEIESTYRMIRSHLTHYQTTSPIIALSDLNGIPAATKEQIKQIAREPNHILHMSLNDPTETNQANLESVLRYATRNYMTNEEVLKLTQNPNFSDAVFWFRPNENALYEPVSIRREEGNTSVYSIGNAEGKSLSECSGMFLGPVLKP
jgi:hypothetical protein